MKKTTVLMVLDGFGISSQKDGNAIRNAKTPNLHALLEKYPHTYGYASGLDVGLPEGQMGNSEVGHLNIGAGRIVYQEFTRISKSIKDGDFFENPELLYAVENCKKHDSAFHIMGLVSDGGVHSHNTHLYALLQLAKKNGLKKVYVHAFLDGRDTPPASGVDYIRQLEEQMREMETGEIVTISGRYYAMDRDKHWERIEPAYDAITLGTGEKFKFACECVENSYKNEIYDEFLVPAKVLDKNGEVIVVEPNDSLIFFNFRPDRAREITHAFRDKDFNCFKRKKDLTDGVFVCFTEYDVTIKNKLVAFKQQRLNNILGEYLSNMGLNQLRLAETEKYAHVTFFFNGGVEEPFPNEDRILIPSPRVPTYDLKPEMSAFAVTEVLIKNILSKEYDVIIINYANPDMVGHTGIMSAAIKAIESVDTCLGQVYDAVMKSGAQMFICADHGNSDQMIDYETGEPFTAHTTNPVPFILVNYNPEIGLREGGRLSDVAPTILEMIGLKIPEEMTGKSLLKKIL